MQQQWYNIFLSNQFAILAGASKSIDHYQYPELSTEWPMDIQIQQFDPLQYLIKTISNHNIICFREIINQLDQLWKIYIPLVLIQPAIRWYHLVLEHPGSQLLYDTIRSKFYHPGLSVLCQQYRCHNNCSMYKNNGRPYGHLAMRQGLLAPWTYCAVDLFGPWKITIDWRPIVFKALRISINPVTNLLEIIRINDKLSSHMVQQFSNCWLSRYP